MALEEAGWSTWLTPQQIADLTGLGGDFGGDATEFVDACGRENWLVKGGFDAQAKGDDSMDPRQASERSE
jgi:hypothetical protein